jgi:hypothetical protein
MSDYEKGLIGYTNQREPAKPMLPLDENERNVIAYFFAKLKLSDQRFYAQAMPDERTESITKRDYANKLRHFTKEQVDQGFEKLRKLMAANHADYRFLTIPKVIGVIDGTAEAVIQEGVQAGAYNHFKPLGLPEPMEHKQQRYKTGSERCQELLAMLDDKPEPKPLTDAEKADLERLERIKNERI